MNPYISMLLCLMVCVALAACGETADKKTDNQSQNNTDQKQGSLTYWKDAKPILDAYCVNCHQAGEIAPFELDRYDNIDAVKAAISQSVEQNTMPPWPAAAGHQNYRYTLALPDAHKRTLLQWIEQGASEGNASDEGQPINVDLGGLKNTDVTLTMPESYSPDERKPDDYRCFVLKWPKEETSYITGFQVVPGNRNSVHHVVNFIVPPRQAQDVDAFMENRDAPGYPCFGGPTPTGEELRTQIQYQFGGQWAPGMPGTPTPKGTGVKIEPGSRIIMQMHYNTLAGGDLADQTSVKFATQPTVEKRGYSVAWTNIRWIITPTRMKIPAGAAEVKHSFKDHLGKSPTVQFLAEGLDTEKPLLIHSIFPHMHKLGKSIAIRVHRADGVVTVLDIPNYDFDWQFEYFLETPVVLNPEDKVEIECVWDNSPAHRMSEGIQDMPIDVGWGEGTQDEMCVSLLYVTQMD